MASRFSLVKFTFGLNKWVKKTLRLPPARSLDQNLTSRELDTYISLNFVQAHRAACTAVMELMHATQVCDASVTRGVRVVT